MTLNHRVSDPQHDLLAGFVLMLSLLLDIVLNFRTTFFHRHTGDEVVDTRKIAKNYVLGGKFAIDLLASIPIDLIVEYSIGG